MNNLWTKSAAALVVGGAMLATSMPADAQRYRDRYYRDRDRTGTAVVAGVAGLAIGAALASRNSRYYDRGYYNDYYYDGPRYRGYDRRYYDGPRYRGYHRGYYGGRYRCETRRVWDPYLGRRVRVRYC